MGWDTFIPSSYSKNGASSAVFMDVDCGTDACLVFDLKKHLCRGFVLNLEIVVHLSSSKQSSHWPWSTMGTHVVSVCAAELGKIPHARG